MRRMSGKKKIPRITYEGNETTFPTFSQNRRPLKCNALTNAIDLRSDKLRKTLFALWQCQSQPWKMGRATSKAPTTIRHVAVNLSSLFDFVCRSNTLLNIQHINEYSAYQ